MPYPNEHSARLQQPGRFNPDTFRRADDGTIYGRIKVPQTAAVIWGKLKGHDKPADKPIPQAIRFPTKSWTADQAKKWLKDNNIRYINFEPATGGKKEGEAVPANVAATKQTIIADLKGEIWAMEAHALEGLLESIVAQTTIPPMGVEISVSPSILRMDGQTAVIPVKGVLLREVPKAFIFWGIESTSYLAIQEQLNMALADPMVKAVKLDIDSPGGAVTGVDETAELIKAVRKVKPVTAVVDDLCASAAYWLGSQAEKIESVKNGMAGSIGVFCVYHDRSEMAKELGIKVIVIRSGEHKGMGVPGDIITQNQIAAVQEIINGTAENFIAAVSAGRGRKIEDVRQWATGQYWLAETAVKMGVIDKVTQIKFNNSNSKGKAMQDQMIDQQIDAQIEQNQIHENAAKADLQRLKDLKAAFPDDLNYAVESFENGLTIEQAKAAYCDILRDRLKAKGAGSSEKKSEGAKPLKSETTDSGTGGEFIQRAKEMAEEKKITMTEAMRRLARSDPQLHQTFRERSKTEGQRMYAEAV